MNQWTTFFKALFRNSVRHVFFLSISFSLVTYIFDQAAQGQLSVSTSQASEPKTLPADSQSTETSTSKRIIPIEPGTSIQSVVDRYPGDTIFLIKNGIHRLQRVTPKSGNTFLGENGSILSGARLLTEFIKEGKYWVVTGQTQQGQVHGKCQKESNGNQPTSCRYPEDLFQDDVSLPQVTNISELTPYKWFFDYDHDRIYLANDPTGHKIETSVTSHAFEGTVNNVTINGLIIEKYANPAQHGAIHAMSGKDWIVEDSEVRLNHGTGIRSGENIQVLRCDVHHNGQLGIGGSGENILIQDNEIAYNNTQEFKRSWEAGGTKFVKTRNLIIRENFAHNNQGPGLWTDIDNINTLYERNRVEDNERAGIFHEISYAAIIRDNIVKRNGLGFPTWLWGSGILIAASSDTEVYRNTVTDNADGIGAIQQKRGIGVYGPHIVKNLYVHDNIVSMTTGNTGLVQDIEDSTCFTDRNNRFEGNIYQLLDNQKKYFLWMNNSQTVQTWQSHGQDQKGKFQLSSHS